MKKQNFVVKAWVSSKQSMGRAERDLIRRHEAALKEIERWDVARELRPHRPKLANDVLRMDDAAALNWEAPVIKAMARQAGPLTGPRTGTHPMAEKMDRPMATRIRPPLQDFEALKPRVPEVLATAALFALIAGAILIAIGISR